MSQNPNAAIQSVALVMHRASFGHESDSFSILAHDIHHTGDKSVLGAGRVFGHEDKMALLHILGDYRGSDLEFLDAKCLASSHETMMWYRPRQKTLMNINGTDHTVMVPSLVFLLHKARLFVAAYRGDKRPERDTTLFHCSLPNIQSNVGNWCTGGNRLPDRPHQGQIEGIEDMFFLSPFTHWNSDYAASNDAEPDMDAFFESLAGKRNFPNSKLKEMGCGLHDWMKHLTSSRKAHL